MTTSSYEDDSSYSATTYMNNKGINELFEAIMIALMVHKPNDHIQFMRECLNKARNNPYHIRWDSFVTKSSSSSFNRNRQRALPPVHSNNSTSFHPYVSRKPSILPPIELTQPIIFILSSAGSINLCSRLLERYHQMKFLSINYVANIDEDEPIDLEQHEHRYDYIHHAIEQHRSQANGFLIAGELDERYFLKQWQKRVGRIDLVFIMSSDIHQIISSQNLHIIQLNSKIDFEDILSRAIHYLDELFPQDAFLSHRSQTVVLKTNYFSLPILFCIDNHHTTVKENDLLLDDEVENNNLFISELCQRLAEHFTFKHIHYEDSNQTFWNFDQLKREIIKSTSTHSGCIIDHFPTSFNDLQRFQSEIGYCSALIYIGEHRTDEVNAIIEKFKENKKAIYVNRHMEVDEIYEDVKRAILKHI